MKETEKIFNQIEEWSREEGTDRASVVIMADLTTYDVSLLTCGTLRERARLVEFWMNNDKEAGHALYAAACLYAHKHIGAKERDKINAAASAIAAKRDSAG